MSRPWMAFYVADYLADTSHLTTLQHGAYVLLIMHYWRRGGIPSDSAQLAQIVRMSEKEWKANGATILEFFEDDFSHKRIDAELAHADEISNKRKAAALHKHSKSSANAPEMHTQSQSQSQAQKKKERIRAPRGTRLLDDWKPSDEARLYTESLLGEDGALAEFDKFRDYWRGVPGARGIKTDWDGTWRNWCRRAGEFNGGRNGNKASGRSLQDDNLSVGKATERIASDIAGGNANFAPRPSLVSGPSESNLRLLPPGRSARS